MAQIARKTKRYPSDLTDEEWDRIAPLMPRPGRRGRPREVDFREVINAVRYLVRSGCGWRMLPVHFGAWQTVYGWFRELARRFLFQTIHDVELMLDRERQGREQNPSAAAIVYVVDEPRKMLGDIVERLERHRVNCLDLERLHEAFRLGVVYGLPRRLIELTMPRAASSARCHWACNSPCVNRLGKLTPDRRPTLALTQF